MKVFGSFCYSLIPKGEITNFDSSQNHASSWDMALKQKGIVFMTRTLKRHSRDEMFGLMKKSLLKYICNMNKIVLFQMSTVHGMMSVGVRQFRY